MTIVGKTQARSSLVAKNLANNASVTGKAGDDGAFKLVLAIATGPNGIRITATDPAHNQAAVVINVNRGAGKLRADITASRYQFSRKRLPDDMTLTAAVTDPDGHPLDGATVTFTLTPPGVAPITRTLTTDGEGKGALADGDPEGGSLGRGVAAALVHTKDFGEHDDPDVHHDQQVAPTGSTAAGRRSYHPAMPVWRCPHCGTPQAEAARCWVCRRSSTSCATCANFRHAVFGGLGYCGARPRARSPLQGDEIRPCWVAPTTLVAEAVSRSRSPTTNTRSPSRSSSPAASRPSSRRASGSSSTSRPGPTGWADRSGTDTTPGRRRSGRSASPAHASCPAAGDCSKTNESSAAV